MGAITVFIDAECARTMSDADWRRGGANCSGVSVEMQGRLTRRTIMFNKPTVAIIQFRRNNVWVRHAII